jgi:hypothetical protein
MIYQLSDEEKQLALSEAERRQSVNEQNNSVGRNRGIEKGSKALMLHKIGSLGEMAVASYLGLNNFLYCDKTPKKDSCDLPFRIDVKTRSRLRFNNSCAKFLALHYRTNEMKQGWIQKPHCLYACY